MERYLMTHSLLSSWLYAMRDNPYEDAETERDPMEDFMRTLCRKPTPTTDVMRFGIDFENLVMGILNGAETALYHWKDKTTGELLERLYPLPEHPWHEAASQVAGIVRGGSFQHKAKKEITVGGVTYLLYGRLDALKAGTIYDIKFSGNYERGKFEASTQHPVYMELLPEARTFTYLVSNGRDVWRETYRRDETRSVYPIIADFAMWLEARELTDVYHQHWLAR